MSGCIGLKIRVLFQGLLLLLGSVVFTGLAAEWALRFFRIQGLLMDGPQIYIPSNSLLSYELKPDLKQEPAWGVRISTNELGFRSPPVDRSKPVLAFMGDSEVFGWGVYDNETMGYFLQKLTPHFSVVASGVPGYNLVQEVEQFRQKVKKLDPKTLVLLFVFNDQEESLAVDREGRLVPEHLLGKLPSYEERLNKGINGTGTLSIPFKSYLQIHSALFLFVERSTKGFRVKPASDPLIGDTWTDQDLKNYAFNLHRLSEEAGGVKKLFVIWPYFLLEQRTRAALKCIADKEGFRVLDLYDIFGNQYPNLGWDGHPSPATNKKTASAIAAALNNFEKIGSQCPAGH